MTTPARRPLSQSPLSLPTLPRVAALLWLALGLALGVKAFVSPVRHSIWPIFAAAAEHWRSGESLYRYYPGLDMYRYSPTFAVALSPLVSLPLGWSGAAWALGSLFILYRGLHALHRDVLSPLTAGPNRSSRDRAMFLLVSGVGVAPMAWNFQSNTLLLGLVGLGTAAIARNQFWRAAFLLAAPVYIKLWPLAWMMVVVGLRPRQMGVRSLVALAALGLAPFLAGTFDQGLASYAEWKYILVFGESLRWPGYRDLLTVAEALDVSVNPQAYRVVQLAGAAAVFAAAAAVAWRRGLRDGLGVGLAFWLCWQLLVGPGSERNTYGMIVPLIAWEVRWRARAGRGTWVAGLALALVLMGMAGDVERKLPTGRATLPLAVGLSGLVVAAGRFAGPYRINRARSGPRVLQLVVRRAFGRPHSSSIASPRTSSLT